MTIVHYTTLETGLNHIVEKMKLRFGPISSTNDPKEYKDMADVFILKNMRDKANKSLQVNGINNTKKAKEKIKISSFVDENDLDWKKGKGIRKPRMWAQYSGNHSGMALAFNKMSLLEECKKKS